MAFQCFRLFFFLPTTEAALIPANVFRESLPSGTTLAWNDKQWDVLTAIFAWCTLNFHWPIRIALGEHSLYINQRAEQLPCLLQQAERWWKYCSCQLAALFDSCTMQLTPTRSKIHWRCKAFCCLLFSQHWRCCHKQNASYQKSMKEGWYKYSNSSLYQSQTVVWSGLGCTGFFFIWIEQFLIMPHKK